MQKLTFLLAVSLLLLPCTNGTYCWRGTSREARHSYLPSDFCRYVITLDPERDGLVTFSAQGSSDTMRSRERLHLEHQNIHQCTNRTKGPFGNTIVCDCYTMSCNRMTAEKHHSGKVRIQWVTRLPNLD